MDLHLIFVFFCVFASALTLPSPRPKYRDYKYSRKTDTFYKLHRDPKDFSEAETVCKAEGAQLMVPSSPQDLHQLFVLIVQHDIGSSVWIGKKEESMNCHVITKDMVVSEVECIGQLPFACKVTAAEVDNNKKCTTHGYRYYAETGSCYSAPPYATTWNEALLDCQKENAHLLVLNSDEEAKTIKAFLKTVPLVPGTNNDMYFLAGFRAEMPSRVFRTIFGKTLEENGYVGWSEYEPNNWSGREYCGSVVRGTGMNNDILCDWQFGFICEQEVSSQITIIAPNVTETPMIEDTINSIDAIVTEVLESNDLTPEKAIQAEEPNGLNHEMPTQAEEPNGLNFETATQAIEPNGLSPEKATQATEPNGLSPEKATQGSEPNGFSTKMATQAAEPNGFSTKMTTQAAEPNGLNHEIASEVTGSNESRPTMAVQASESISPKAGSYGL